MDQVERIVLIGASGAGKSTVGRLLGERLGWSVVDTDAEVERLLGESIPTIFSRWGEDSFRREERRALERALMSTRVIVACGGGAVVDETAWGDGLLGRPDTLVVGMDARPETAIARLRAQGAAEGDAVERPLLATGDPVARIREMKARRQESYDRADLTLVVDGVTAGEVAAELAGLLDRSTAGERSTMTLTTGGGDSAIHVRRGVAARLGAMARARWPKAQRGWIVSDEHVAARYGGEARAALAEAGFDARVVTVPPGERSKSLAEVGRLYDALLGGGIERTDLVVALGGGVVGDLAGFVAATTLRGVGLIQVPTSLLAMVDSSVGGKTGIDHDAGKNLIGAFYQPPLVLIDPVFLETLPGREVTNGWAEIVKHAIIQPSTPGGQRGDLETFLLRNRRALGTLSEPATTYMIGRNVELKGAVVAADEREAGGRAMLNLGHTLGHAIEAAGYRVLHGEAVAVGIRAVARIGSRMGLCTLGDVARIDAALDGAGLPRTAAVDVDRVLSLLGSDKKRSAGRQRWIVPVAGGGVTIRDDVPDAVVREGLEAVVEPVTAVE